MANSPDEIVVGANGSLFFGPVGGPLPATINDPLDDVYKDAGLISEAGVQLTVGKTITGIQAWQLLYAARNIVTARNVTAAAALRQFNGLNIVTAWGGGTIVEDSPGSGTFTYEPPSDGDIDNRCEIVEWEDGDKSYRLILKSGIISDNVQTNLVRTAAADLPITFMMQASPDDGPPFLLQTNDPAFADAITGGS